MRILMTTDTIGGVWTFTQELSAGLLQHGCAVCLASLGGAPSAAQRRWANEMQWIWKDRFRFESSDLPLEWMQDNYRAYREAAPWLERLACAFDVELLHANQFCFGALSVPIPKIVTAHSDVFSWAEACRPAGLEPSAWLTRYYSLVANGLASADSVVAPTRWMAEALARHFPVQQEITTIHNGRSHAGQSSAGRKLQAVTAGRLWDEGKNIALLKDVQSPFPLLVAGEKQYGSNSAPGSAGSITFLGSLSARDLLALFSESAIYICTSVYEPFGLALLEAALCGCAVLAHDIPSLREVWGDSAIYFSGAASLSTLLRQLQDDPDRLREAQQRSCHRARQFSADRMTRSYLRLFQRACERAKDVCYAR